MTLLDLFNPEMKGEGHRWSLNNGPFFFFCFCFFRVTGAAYRGSQARGQIGAAAPSSPRRPRPSPSHSHARSKLPLQPTSQLTATHFNPLSEARDRICIFMNTSRICYYMTETPQRWTLFREAAALWKNGQNGASAESI